MKKICVVLCLLACSTVMAQDCDSLIVNLKKGTINGVKATASMEEVKAKLPCFTGESEEGGPFNCGGGIFYLNHDFYYYTGNDYIEVRSNFSGNLSIPVLGVSKAAAVKKLAAFGKAVRTQKDGERTFLFFKTAYGCICLTIEADQVRMVDMYSKPAAKVKLCL